MLVLCSIALILLLAACTPDLAGVSTGWSSTTAVPAAQTMEDAASCRAEVGGGREMVVYIGTKQGDVTALCDDGSGRTRVIWTFRPPSGSEQ